MAVISANRYLKRAEMEGNASYLWGAFSVLGWSINAVAAMLGNMETESTINPGIYQSLNNTSTTNGFGLVQWTPNTKYKEWADANGFSDYGDINGQIARIQYERTQDLQWIPTDNYDLSFNDFATSTLAVEYLAQAFLYNYERPANLNQPNRSIQARRWYNYLLNLPGGTTPDIPLIPNNDYLHIRPMSKLLLYFVGIQRR